MPVNGRVSVGWQILFAFIPFVNFWAFARIKKFRQFLLYFFLPNLAVNAVIWIVKTLQYGGVLKRPADENGLMYPKPPLPSYVNPEPRTSEEILSSMFNSFNILDNVGYVISLFIFMFSLYLIIRWSRLWNRQFTD